MSFIHGFEDLLGLTDASGTPYLFWSGVFSDITLIGAGIAFLRPQRCHVHGCWRWGPHKVGDGAVSVCYKHHPALPNKITAAVVADLHRATPSPSGPTEHRN